MGIGLGPRTPEKPNLGHFNANLRFLCFTLGVTLYRVVGSVHINILVYSDNSGGATTIYSPLGGDI